MTQNQIAYQNLKEGIRHNLATESISSTSNAINREHYIRADQAALSQAESAAKNASTNAYNASINYMNALTNQRQADASLQNAASNRMNAVSNQRQADASLQNAAANWRNAATNAMNAETNRYNAQVNARIAPSTIAANYGKAEQSKASAFKSTVDSYGEHPAVAALVASGATDEIAKAGTSVVGGIKHFFTSTGDPSPVTIGVGYVSHVTAKSSINKGGGGARHTANHTSRRVGPRVVHD